MRELSELNFKDEISSGVTLVDFWAPWCGPCRMIAPILEELDKEYAGKLKICKVNVDNDRLLAQSLRIVSIPTLILYKDGEEQKRIVGAVAKEKITREISPFLA
ncbi:thioredoxin [Thermodesulfobium acidiphilum]|uniref:Thioredoxin n=1 Tax=Thermodesulfobium acidiphilum TaxID=1794699 RepID=A0A2R4W1N9_THEAF|nr:thioredoxin [Thermodesulfobium acidiphilum]AWB10689.1 thioredoxin [Thermodesulfobium acidiphilum]